MRYAFCMEYEIKQTDTFQRWLKKLKDRTAVLAIAARLDRAMFGNFGDSKAVGDGVREMRVFVGPGYRIYYTIRGRKIILMLCGGDKSSQTRDIHRAKGMAERIKEEDL